MSRKVLRLYQDINKLCDEELGNTLVWILRSRLSNNRSEATRRNIPFPHPIHLFSDDSTTTSLNRTYVAGKFTHIAILSQMATLSQCRDD
ncbi:hypothetical protein BBBOND_0301130 [Babesia bigemina]|uniref:Uncharacterized protein n=1 Tax=Babesia bigemina TaxID=5866 RepID=A0A061D6M3_BABBI|nr:hypothetical protein BBBOND_0301130 [Babesia bigemina]CDR96208.1 hypothetical protein BBBOND_0301130 [Babesia bigemina]|eukprot:XP_012768394.1 hypothetical protein BBBOND_0301130 [Babesia bigemina]